LLASDDRGSDLATGQNRGGSNFDFGPAYGIVRDRNERVGGVESHADDIYSFYSFFCLREFGHPAEPAAVEQL
jgi:hypothetical protein